MSRLDFKTQDRAERTVEGLYRDLERRIIASPPGLCPVDMAAAFLKLCHAQTCGKCVPCRVGLGQLENLLQDVLSIRKNENVTLDIIPLIEKTAQAIYDSADCAIGFEAANMVLKGLKGFREEYEEHILHQRCSASIQKLKHSVSCVELCPAGVDVPGYAALVREGRCEDAVRLIRKDNPFPTVCALICEHPCEARCRRNMIDSSVNIRGLKRYAVDNAKNVPVPERMPLTGKRVAIIGGGPTGLTAAYFLALMGHNVKIFEKREQLGGMLRYGIPSYRLPRERLQEDIDTILSVGGIDVETSFDVANEATTNEIRNSFDAIYLGIGAHIHKQIGIPGEYSRGVVSAVEMLRGIGDGTMPDFQGKEVVVIGGGNVAMDVARTAKRLGASTVNIVYRRRKDDMTALAEEIDGAIAEGCNLLTLQKPARIDANHDGTVERLWIKPQIIGTNDKAGRPSPVDADLPEQAIPCQIIISAIGQAIDSAHFESLGIPVNRGSIKAQSTSGIEGMPGIFAGGDCVTGPSTVIAAISAGKVAAANIDAYLGYHHEIEVDIDIPEPRIEDKPACGRIDLKVRLANDRGEDFMEIEQGMTEQEAYQEASRCLRCDRFGYGAFRGGRTSKW